MLSPAAVQQIQNLRLRLLRALGVTGALIIGLYTAKEWLLALLLKPLMEGPNAPGQVVFSAVPELFFTYLKISTWGGVFLALPYVFYELWGFISPGLYARERRMIWPLLVAVPLLFYAGGLFAYFFVTPAALGFFLSFSQPGITALPQVGDYLKLLFNFSFALGLAFNMPVVLVLLVRVGILSAETLRRGRRLAVVLVFVFAAFVTPPDPLSQILLALPLIALYEAAILATKWLKL